MQNYMSDKCQSRVLDTVKFHLQDFYLEFLADKKTIYLSSLAAIKELLTSKTIRDKISHVALTKKKALHACCIWTWCSLAAVCKK